MTLVIGNKNLSSWSLRPWIVLTHFKIPFREIKIFLRQPDSKKNILKYSPSGKVPLLIHGKLKVWDSIAICEYLADLFPQKNLWPRDKKARAVARSISAEMHSEFQALRSNCSMNVTLRKPHHPQTPASSLDIERIVSLWTNCRKIFGKKGSFLFGDFSIADAMYAPVIFRFSSYGVSLSGAARIYFETMLELPAMKAWARDAAKEVHLHG